MTPYEWRSKSRLTLAAAAQAVGVVGKNPARTWQRWESGARRPPLNIMARLHDLSDGRVTSSSWAFVRSSYLARRRSVLSTQLHPAGEYAVSA